MNAIKKNYKISPLARIAMALILVSVQSDILAMIEPLPSITELKNLTYKGIYDYPVTLEDGVYEGDPFVPGGASRPRVQFADQLQVSGDLDGDGEQNIAVLLTEHSGGSGENTFLAVVSRQEGRLENVATRHIGDRIQVRSLIFERGALVLEFVTTDRGEPACCPTLKARNTYRLQGNELTEISSKKLGHISLADLADVSWKLTHLAWNESVPKDIEITAVFERDKVSGSAGCNRYFANVNQKTPRDISIGPIGMTRMICHPSIMQVEDRYLKTLHKIEQFSFIFGKLALAYQDEKRLDTLLFVASQ